METKTFFLLLNAILWSINIYYFLYRYIPAYTERRNKEKRFQKSLAKIESHRTKYDSPDRNSCVPITLSMTTGWDFRSSQMIASYYMKRRKNEGVRSRDIKNFMGMFKDRPIYGHRFEKVRVKNTRLRDTMGWEGVYFVLIPGHALTVKDGEIISSARDNLNSKVLGVWKVVKKNM